MDFITIALWYWYIRRIEKKVEKEQICKQLTNAVVPVTVVGTRDFPSEERSAQVEHKRDLQGELREVQRYIEQELQVLNNTKDPETGIRCFAAIRKGLSRLSEEIPLNSRITMQLGQKEFCREVAVGGGESAVSFKKLEHDWLRDLFIEKSDMLLKQAEETADLVVKTELVRKALRTALQGLEYLPHDEQLRHTAETAELRLSFLSGDGHE